jgi:hypothetical protein
MRVDESCSGHRFVSAQRIVSYQGATSVVPHKAFIFVIPGGLLAREESAFVMTLKSLANLAEARRP